jgi:Protein of unknown function (DUF2637)
MARLPQGSTIGSSDGRPAVLSIAVVAAVVSYEHASALVRAHGEPGWTGRFIPLTVDSLICASSMVVPDAVRRGIRVSAAGAVAVRLEHCRDARRERPGTGPDRCHCGRMVDGHARRLV